MVSHRKYRQTWGGGGLCGRNPETFKERISGTAEDFYSLMTIESENHRVIYLQIDNNVTNEDQSDWHKSI